MRGTDDLLPEQRPRSRKMRGRTQPYRRRKNREQGPTLTAMLKGGPMYLPNPIEFQRDIQRGARGSQRRRKRPRAGLPMLPR